MGQHTGITFRSGSRRAPSGCRGRTGCLGYCARSTGSGRRITSSRPLGRNGPPSSIDFDTGRWRRSVMQARERSSRPDRGSLARPVSPNLARRPPLLIRVRAPAQAHMPCARGGCFLKDGEPPRGMGAPAQRSPLRANGTRQVAASVCNHSSRQADDTKLCSEVTFPTRAASTVVRQTSPLTKPRSTTMGLRPRRSLTSDASA